MRILLIGGTGFIGRRVTAGLAGAGHEVAVLHRGRTEPKLPDGVIHFHDECASIPVVEVPDSAVAFEPEVVVHVVPLGEEDAAAAVDAFAGRARRLVAVSSADVYRVYGRLVGIEPDGDPGRVGPLAEDAPLRSRLYPYGRDFESPYGRIPAYEKILVERTVRAAESLEGTILRLGKVYGPGDRQRTFGGWVERMGSERTLPLGERQARWRWTHGYVADVARAIGLAATVPGAAGRIYNVGEPAAPSTLERARRLAEAVGWEGEVVVVPDEEVSEALRTAPAYEPDLVLDSTRIREELGWEEKVPEAETLRRTADWLRRSVRAG